MTAGVAAKSFYSYGFQTYNWTTAYKPVDAVSAVWTTLTPAADAGDAQAIKCTVQIKYAGAVTLKWGTRLGAYGAYSLPFSVPANTPVNLYIRGLKRKATYYINGVANVTIPNSAGGLPITGSYQFGEVSFPLP